MMSRTRTRLGCLSGAATFVRMSRSVTMPIGFPVSSRWMSYADREGECAVRIAREALDAFVLRRARRPVEIPNGFEEKSGAFVTLNDHPGGLLRGCIGYPQPFFPLVKSIEKGAEGAAEDPRFPRLSPEELDRVTVEVSILTAPQLIEVKKPKDLAKHVTPGADGLSVAQGPYRGLLLPHVAAEYGWDAAESLSEAGMKAGLPAHPWLAPATRGYKFQAEVFAETKPRGPVVRRTLEAAGAGH